MPPSPLQRVVGTPEQWAEIHAYLESLRHGLDRGRTEEVDEARARLDEFSGLRISTLAGSLGPAPDPVREVITVIEGRLDPKPPASDHAGSGAGDSREP